MRWKITGPIIAILLLLTAQIHIHKLLDRSAEKQEIIQTNPFSTLPPTEYLAEYLSTMLLGGFKPFMVDYLWIQAEKLREDKQFLEVRALLSLIARFQPRLTQVWAYNAWNMAYNISRQETDPALRWRWVKEAINYLQEGQLRNPDSAYLTSEIAFMYYFRIPQEPNLIAWCAKEEGADCYILAMKWYEQAITTAKRKNYSLYSYEVMWLSSCYLHAYELLKQNKFQDGASELTRISTFCREYLAARYKFDTKRWLRDSQDYLDIKKIFEQESLLFQAKYNNDLTQYAKERKEVLHQYEQLIKTHIGLNFDPINARVETLLLEYLNQVYVLINNGHLSEAQTLMQYLTQYSASIIPEDPENHPARWFYEYTAQRFQELSPIIEAEAKTLESYQAGAKPSIEALNNVLNLYKPYIKKYSDLERFNLQSETKRVEYLKQLIK
jgi:hypothetical protein